MRQPRTIRINGKVWSVRKKSITQMGDDTYGLCAYDKARIDIRTGQTTFDTRDTFLHEVMHAVLYQQGREDCNSEEEEKYVRALATGVMGVLQDNPEFAKWLIQPINSRKPATNK